MILLIDIGNTHTHIGLGDEKEVCAHADFSTHGLTVAERTEALRGLGSKAPDAAVICSVVPDKTSTIQVSLRQAFNLFATELNHASVKGIGIDYPNPETIGPDRLANAIAAKVHYGAPSVVVDFGTAVTFDVVNAGGNYTGGIIAPGIAAMTDYLHEKTALLPRIEIEEPQKVVGKSTREAMLSGAFHGYRGLIRELLKELKGDLGVHELNGVATGGYAGLIAKGLPGIVAIEPNLTLEGLRLFHYA
jgi:type III pantothenate kinase